MDPTHLLGVGQDLPRGERRGEPVQVDQKLADRVLPRLLVQHVLPVGLGVLPDRQPEL